MIPEKTLQTARLVQLGNLIRDNQFATAAVVFVLWQADVVSTVAYHIGGVC